MENNQDWGKRKVVHHLKKLQEKTCHNCTYAMIPHTHYTACDHPIVDMSSPEKINFSGCGYWKIRGQHGKY